MTTTTERTTDTTPAQIGTSASAAYDRLLIEATYIAYRIAEQLANAAFPEGLDSGNVGDMAETVRELRQVSDRMFGEGEHDPESR